MVVNNAPKAEEGHGDGRRISFGRTRQHSIRIVSRLRLSRAFFLPPSLYLSFSLSIKVSSKLRLIKIGRETAAGRRFLTRQSDNSPRRVSVKTRVRTNKFRSVPRDEILINPYRHCARLNKYSIRKINLFTSLPRNVYSKKGRVVRATKLNRLIPVCRVSRC